MTSIPFVIGRTWRNQFKCSYLKNKQLFRTFFPHFRNLHQILNILKKKATVIAYEIQTIRNAKDVISYIAKKPRFRTPFESQHAKEVQLVLKSAQ